MDPSTWENAENTAAAPCSCGTLGSSCRPSAKPLERRRMRLRQHQRCLAHSLVGTPNYIAPEVLLRKGMRLGDAMSDMGCVVRCDVTEKFVLFFFFNELNYSVECFFLCEGALTNVFIMRGSVNRVLSVLRLVVGWCHSFRDVGRSTSLLGQHSSGNSTQGENHFDWSSKVKKTTNSNYI